MPQIPPRTLRTGLLAGSLAVHSLFTPHAAGQIQPEPLTFVDGIRRVGLVDVDGDGTDELVGTSGINQSLKAYSIAADGSIAFERTLTPDSAPSDNNDITQLQLADLDGDGQADLVGLRPHDAVLDEIVVFYSRGSSQFEGAVALDQVGRDLKLVATDFDLDGDIDAVLYPASDNLAQEVQPRNRFWIVRNLGGGLFGRVQVAQSFVELLGGAAPIALGQDGDQDFVGLRGTSATLVIARNVGGMLELSAVTGSRTGYVDLDVGDVNADGLPDVVAFRRTAQGASASIDLFLGAAGGTLEAPIAVFPSAGANLAADISLGDFDGDSDLDIAITTLGLPLTGHRALVLTGNGQGAFAATEPPSDGVGQATTRSVIGDLNGDGRDDLVNRSIAQRSGGAPLLEADLARIGVSTGGAAGLEQALETSDFFLDGTVLTGDLDGDGVLDLVAGSADELVWLRGAPGSDRFGLPSSLLIRGAPLLAGDFDADGVDEILVSLPNGGGLRIVDGRGGGAFGPVITPTLTLPPMSSPLFVSDFDGDGDFDILANSNADGRLYWLSNLGGFNFAAALDPLVDPSPHPNAEYHIGDFNGDGRVDVLRGKFAFPSLNIALAWFDGLGGGVLGAPEGLGNSSGANLVADLDRDGFDDVVAHESFTAGRVTWIKGGPNGLQPSSETEIVASIGLQQLLGVADMDGDGLFDLITSLGTGEVFGYRRLAGVAVAFDQVAVPLSGARTTASGQAATAALATLQDFGADGDLDLMVSRTVTPLWYENVRRGPVGARFCGPAVPNSTGVPSRILSVGTHDADANSLTLRAADLPTNAFGFFIASLTSQPAAAVPASSGRICLAGAIGRYVGPGQVNQSGLTGTFALDLDLTAIPQPLGFVAAQPGATWFFQAWHRDISPAGPTSNFTDGLQVTFE